MRCAWAWVAALAGSCAVLAQQTPKYKAIWEPVNYRADLKLFSVCFTSDDVGWAAGGTDELHGGVILHTTDGGNDWKLELGDPGSSDRAVRSLRFLNASTGWAVEGTGSRARLLHTTDGESWTQTGSIPENYRDYVFLSERRGVLVNSREIEVTEDGGNFWKPVAPCQVEAQVDGLTRRIPCEFQAISFPTPNTGYAAASSSSVRSAFYVFRTSDGGATWTSMAAQADAGAQDVAFVDEKVGYVRAGAPDTGRLYRSADGGSSWTGIASSPGARILFADPGVGWAFYGNKMSYTTNGGTNWSSRSIPFPAEERSFSLPSRSRGYVVGDHGMIYRYRIVPVSYSAAGMLDAPMMPARQ